MTSDELLKCYARVNLTPQVENTVSLMVSGTVQLVMVYVT